MIVSFGLHSRWVHPKYTWSRNDVRPSISTFFINFSHMGAKFCFSPAMYHPRTLTEITLVSDERTYFPTSVPSSLQVSNNASSSCLSHSNLANGWPCKFRSRGSTKSSIFPHARGHLCRGRRVQTSGHSDLGMLSNLGAASNFTWV